MRIKEVQIKLEPDLRERAYGGPIHELKITVSGWGLETASYFQLIHLSDLESEYDRIMQIAVGSLRKELKKQDVPTTAVEMEYFTPVLPGA